MFVELVCGPPGSGKTTYCEGKRQLLSVYDPCRPVIIFNLDPANDGIFPYPCDINICELISHKAVMEEIQLGPNGTYLYCIDFIAANMDWVRDQIKEFVEIRVNEVEESYPTSQGNPLRAPYVLIDCPGQVEFYLYSESMLKLIRMIQKELRGDICVVHLTDAGIATRDVPTYISTCMLCLSCMVDMELPHVNVLTKWNTLEKEPTFEELMGTSAAAAAIGEQWSKGQAKQYLKTKKVRVRDSGLRGPYNEPIPEVLPPSPSSSSSLDNEDMVPEEGVTVQAVVKELQEDAAVGDTNELFLETTEFFNNHLDRMWRLKDRGTYRHVVLSRGGGTSQRASYRDTKLYKLCAAITSVIDSHGLVGFEPLDVENQELMVKLTQKIDNALGNFFH